MRARPAAAPSRTRWSNVRLSVHAVAPRRRRPRDEGARRDHAERDRDRVGRVQQRRAGFAPVAPRVAHRDRGVGDVLGMERARARGLREAADLGGDFGDRAGLGVADDRDDQPAVGVDRDPDVDGPMGHDRVVGPGGVQQRMRPDRSADCRDDDRQGRHLPLASGLQRGGVHRSERRDLGDRGRLLQPAGDRSADRGDGIGSPSWSIRAVLPAARTSSAVTRPPGPLPASAARSTPDPSRASGRPAWPRPARSSQDRPSPRVTSPPAAEGSWLASFASSSGAPATRNVTRGAPTATASRHPVQRRDRSRVRRGDPTVAFAVSTSTSGWFSVTSSPSATSHATISPSSSPSPRSGIANTRSAISTRAPRGSPRRSDPRSAGSELRATPAGTARPTRSRARPAPPGGRTPPRRSSP